MAPADPYVLLAPLCAAAVRSRTDVAAPAARAAIEAGCSRREVREALLLLVPFAGFPRAFDALAAAQLAPAEPRRGGAGGRARGLAAFEAVYGADADAVRAKLRALDPDVAEWVVDHAYGRVLSRPGLAMRERERLAVVLLAAQGLRNQLPGHVRGALRCGATSAAIEASLAAAAPFLPSRELAFARRALRRASERSA